MMDINDAYREFCKRIERKDVYEMACTHPVRHTIVDEHGIQVCDLCGAQEDDPQSSASSERRPPADPNSCDVCRNLDSRLAAVYLGSWATWDSIEADGIVNQWTRHINNDHNEGGPNA